jgi:hypothetical protein
MLSVHSKRRDHNSLPIVVRGPKELLGFVGEERNAEQLLEVQNWNANHTTLCSVVESLSSLLDRIEFLETHVLNESIRANNPKAPACTMNAIASTNNSLVKDEIAQLNDRDVLARRRFEEILAITRLVAKYSLRDIPENLLDAIQSREPRTLIRMFKRSSHSGYSNSLGFLCSNWKSSKAVKGIANLQKDNRLFEQSLRNHCEGSAPSGWISLIDNIPEALKFIETWKFNKDPTSRVALVSIAKLNRLNIICEQSYNLVKMAGGNPYRFTNKTGIQLAWSSHYLVREWIPAECICRVFNLRNLSGSAPGTTSQKVI